MADTSCKAVVNMGRFFFWTFATAFSARSIRAMRFSISRISARARASTTPVGASDTGSMGAAIDGSPISTNDTQEGVAASDDAFPDRAGEDDTAIGGGAWGFDAVAVDTEERAPKGVRFCPWFKSDSIGAGIGGISGSADIPVSAREGSDASLSLRGGVVFSGSVSGVSGGDVLSIAGQNSGGLRIDEQKTTPFM